ncbi:MAG: SLC13 family permease, partial [Candidatus Omnitrophota bacterium]
MSNREIALLIFLISYLFFVIFPRRRVWTALISALAIIFLRIITLREAFLSINWNVMGIFIGTLLVADVFMESRMPAYIAEKIVNRSKNVGVAILSLCILTGFISAFVENVATVLLVAPVAFSLAKKLKINPTNMMIAIAISSNLQGTATLIGDPPSMLLAGFAKLNFMDFFFQQGKPSIFFAVEIGAIVSFRSE